MVANAPRYQPRFLLGRVTQDPLVTWPCRRANQIGRFSSTPSSALAKRSKALKHSRGPLQVPKGSPPAAKEHLALRLLPAVARYPRPVEIFRPKLQAPSASKQHMSPRARSTRSAVRYIICIQFAVYVAWIYSWSHQICMKEECEVPAECGHEICGQVQWMYDNTTVSKVNILAGRDWTLVTAAFSHNTPDHILSNALGLAIFARAFYTAGGVGIGASHIVGLTIGSALFASLTTLIYRWNEPLKSPDSRPDDLRAHCASNGATGVVTAFFTAATCSTPWDRIAIGRFSIPIRIYWFTALSLVTDLILLGNNDRVGHEAHLGGPAFGLAYYLFVLRKPYGCW
jgi:membrane associated rhomboid family serine protease